MSPIPNWASNSITTTTPEIVAALEKAAASKEDRLLNSLVPMPEELKGIRTGSGTDARTGKTVKLWRETPEGNVGLTDEEIADYTERFGTADWYTWSIRSWGTKWDVTISTFSITDLGGGMREAVATFDSAWSPPEAWLAAVADEFPNGHVSLAYAEGGMGYFGLVTYLDGELVEQWTSESFWSEQQDDEGFAIPTTICQHHLDTYGLHQGG